MKDLLFAWICSGILNPIHGSTDLFLSQHDSVCLVSLYIKFKNQIMLPVLMVHIFNTSTQTQRQADSCEFETFLIYIVNSRVPKAT